MAAVFHDVVVGCGVVVVVAVAAGAEYIVGCIGRHLGNFFPKASTKPNFANLKWPTSSPRIHGFDEWFSTEASASSSMCNCNCNAVSCSRSMTVSLRSPTAGIRILAIHVLKFVGTF